MLSQWIDRLWELNPQLFREAKGRLIQRNITIATILSLLGQGLVYLFFRSLLPSLYLEKVVSSDPYRYPENKYCLGTSTDSYNNLILRCIPDALGNVPINWQLWWLDLFMTISLISIIVLAVVGVYLLIADLSKEEQRGTLGFIRLSPQSASSILIGKILGVPILLYWFVGLAIPLHFSAALQAGIPLSLLLAFYGVLGISCSFFYSVSLLFALVSQGLRGFQSWLGSGAILLFMTILTQFFLEGNSISYTPLDWVVLLYPGVVLPYLLEATRIDYNSFLKVEQLENLSWFGQSLWSNTTVGICFIVANFALLNHWIWAGLKRRFHNISTGVWSKAQSYCFLATINLVVLGFIPQSRPRIEISGQTTEILMMINFGLLFGFELLLMLVLIAALSPHRQTLQDWARYRHQEKGYARSLLKDLIWGEKSPAIIAIALNLTITFCMILPLVFLAPLKEYRTVVIGGMLIQASLVMLYATVAQLCLFSKNSKRVIIAAGTVASLIFILPFALFVVFEGDSAVMILSPIPLVGIEAASLNMILLSLFGQWTGLILVGRQLQLQLQKAGESSSKQLMTRGKALRG